MIIKRVYNNNVAMALSDDGRELIVMGKGLAFGRRPGDKVNAADVEKTFTLAGDVLSDAGTLRRMEKVLESIPTEYLAIAEDIVEMLRRELGVPIGDDILIALADHISLSLDRERRGVSCENPLLPEIRQFYRREYELAHRAADIIHAYLGIWISPEEQGFITLHIVNSTMGQRPDRLIKSVQMVADALAVIERKYGVRLDEESFAYERLVRHLQFFARRALDPQGVQEQDAALFAPDKEDFPKAHSCAEAIAREIEPKYRIRVTDAEIGYLVYHIVNLLGEPGTRA